MSMFFCGFELVDHDGDGVYVAYPAGLDGATEGHGYVDAVEMAADWLRECALDFLMRGEKWPELPLDAKPTRGGSMITVAVDASLDQIPAMTAAEAARTLGVSTARVAQLCKAELLESWKVGGTRMVSVDSVESRLADRRAADRARKEDPVLA